MSPQRMICSRQLFLEGRNKAKNFLLSFQGKKYTVRK